MGGTEMLSKSGVNSTTKTITIRPSSLQPAKSAKNQQQIIVIPHSMLVNGCISAKDLKNIIDDSKPSIKTMENRINLKRPSSSGDSTYGTDSEEGSSIHYDEGGDNKPVRKRANLDHLSPEEKMMRRKLKNRVAAQNARDKKRVKMDDMEDRIKQLEDQNKKMLEKQQELLAFNRRLLKENAILSGKSYQDLESTSFIKIEPTTFEETELRHDNVLYAPPLSPESLPRSPSPSSSISSSTMTQQQRLSSLDSDDDSTTSLSSIVSSDCSNVSSLVEQRSVEPAVPINVLQQQELHRRLAGEEICKSQDQESNGLLDPSTAALFWTCLMTTILPVINNLSSSPQTKTKPSSKELLEPLESLILPPKKRICQLTTLKENRLPT